ncbi:protein FRA10AC1 isoform X1 [Quercus lobata]|uniref:protein FRA10AC1 isoform X1 n=1 Tax=Quercus lobata TaxID=97700 RepID=UPI001245F3A5|nr:protein FRA10AC1 isoform X1 [Quercus lobata]
MASFVSLRSEIFDREERKQQYQAHIRGLNAYDRHKKFLKDYASFYGKEDSRNVKLPVKTDRDTLREGYRFIRTEEDDMDPSWEQRLVKRYYDKLFKEYCIADMSQYKTGKIGLRWRAEKEVISGKGQFICGNKHCDEKDDLASYEVNFSYSEAGENKQALVKLVTCERCADKLHYKRRKEKEQSEKREREENKRKSLFPGIGQGVLMKQIMTVKGAWREEKEKRLQFQLMIIKLMTMITLMSFLRGCFHDRLLPYLDGLSFANVDNMIAKCRSSEIK